MNGFSLAALVAVALLQTKGSGFVASTVVLLLLAKGSSFN